MLGVEPKASMDAVQLAYARLSEKFHPKVGTTPDPEKYEGIVLAFEVLSDPELRKDFDKLKGIGGEEKPKFSGRAFFEAYGRDVELRVALLCLLYDRRRSMPFTPSLSMRHIEAMVIATTEEINFALWYLKIRDLVTQDDKSSLQISADGMDYLKNHPPSPDDVLRFIRVESTLDGAGAGAVPTPAAAAPVSVAEPAPTPIPVQPEAPVPNANPAIEMSAARIGNLLLARKRTN